ncbi:MAG TPA: carboxypeptidase regulatory-like domain-containing protein [Bryobacteraceae bacterium]|nr:carboxypeptidase regulatory-like domain-containing protein [Bryobacteraceae bacterium]
MKTIFFFSLFALIAYAQVEQGSITGSVTDPSGASIVGARVTAKHTQTRVETGTSTNSSGFYTIPYLPAGKYEIFVEANGFKRARFENINLTVGLAATVNAVLEVGAVTSEVTVSSTAVQLEQQNASLGQVVSSSQMVELPLLGRNPYSLISLAPGVLPKGGAGSGPIVNGGRSNTSEILLDGAETRNSTTNDINYTPPLEAVHEFKVITNSFSAEYGRSGGGVLTAATRSGTNQLHGSLYEFVRNDILNANSWTNNRNGLGKSPFRRNEFGAAAGGPVWLPKVYDGRNRSFFFLNWEKVPQRSPDDIVRTVPTALERMGDFSQTVDGRGSLIQVYDPLTTMPDPSRPGRYTRQAFPSNRIPANRLDPIALKVMQYFPLPNRTGRVDNFVLNNTRRDDSWKFFMRFDQALGSRHRLFFSHGRTDSDRTSPGVNIAFPDEGVNGERGTIGNRAKSAVLSDTVMFRPNLVGEFRGSVSRNVIKTQPRSAGFDFTQLGLPASIRETARQLIFPRFDVSDVTSLGPDRASYFTDAEHSLEGQGHVTWMQGAHTIKFGADETFQAFNVTRGERVSGQYAFTRAFTQGPDPLTASSLSGFGVATFLLGAPTGGSFSLDPSLAASQKYYAAYAQDDWKIARTVTVNLGMRWEYQTPWSDRFNQLGFFDTEAIDPLTKRKGVLAFTGRDGNSHYQSDPDKNNFAPRLGLAWQATGKTVIRAGGGIFFSPGSGGIGAGASDLGSGFLATTPVFLGQAPDAPNTPPVGASLANPFVTGFLYPPTTGVGVSVTTAFREWVTPYSYQWNLNIQRSLSQDTVIEIACVGTRGLRLWTNRSRTAVDASLLSLGAALDEQVNNPYFGIITSGSLSAARVRRSQLLQPYNHYTGVTRFRDPVGDSIYHGMTLRVEKRMSRGLTFQAAYTVSKSIDDVPERFSGRSGIVDPNNLARSRSVADYDRPQFLVANYIWDLPFGPGRKWLHGGVLAHVIGGWQISGITTLGKGLPLVVSGANSSRLPGVGGSAADRLRSPLLPEGQQTIERWFDTGAFAEAQPYTIGNDSRTQPNLRGPGIRTFDLGLHRNQRIREGINLQFRAEFFNAFNTTQFSEPNTTVSSPVFGQITSAGSPRNIQLGLRLAF